MTRHYTYLLRCADGTIYCGYTTDLEKRLARHNAGKGAKYTKSRLPVSLLKSVSFDNKTDAMSCEWWIKHNLSRQEKLSWSAEQIKAKFLERQKSRD